jgi:hypothetical protein
MMDLQPFTVNYRICLEDDDTCIEAGRRVVSAYDDEGAGIECCRQIIEQNAAFAPGAPPAYVTLDCVRPEGIAVA